MIFEQCVWTGEEYVNVRDIVQYVEEAEKKMEKLAPTASLADKLRVAHARLTIIEPFSKGHDTTINAGVVKMTELASAFMKGKAEGKKLDQMVELAKTAYRGLAIVVAVTEDVGNNEKGTLLMTAMAEGMFEAVYSGQWVAKSKDSLKEYITEATELALARKEKESFSPKAVFMALLPEFYNPVPEETVAPAPAPAPVPAPAPAAVAPAPVLVLPAKIQALVSVLDLLPEDAAIAALTSVVKSVTSDWHGLVATLTFAFLKNGKAGLEKAAVKLLTDIAAKDMEAVTVPTP